MLHIPQATVKSSLGSKIEAEIKKLCEARDMFAADKVNERINAINSILPNIQSNIEKIIQTELNIPTVTIKNLPKSMNAYFTLDMTKDKTEKMCDKLNPHWFMVENTNPKTAKEFITLSENHTMIGFKNPNDVKEILKYFKPIFAVDFAYMLCAGSIVHKEIGDFSSQEVTAILLHEIGHFMSFCKRVGEYGYTLKLQQEHLSYFIQNSSIDDKIKVLEHKLIGIDKIPDSILSKKQKDTLKEIPEIFKEVKYELLKNVGKFLLKSIVSIGLLFLVVIIFLMRIKDSITLLSMDSITNFMIIPMIGNIVDKKDIPFHKKQISELETEADMFTAFHGYGNYIISGLTKIEKASLFSDTLMGTSFTSSKLLYFYYSFVQQTMLIANGGVDSTGGYIYEDSINRALTIKNKLISFLKRSDLSEDLLIMYINSIKQADIEIQKTIKNNKTSLKITKFVDTLFSLVGAAGVLTLANQLIRGSLPKDLEKAFAEIEQLKNNQLYVSAAILKTYKIS